MTGYQIKTLRERWGMTQEQFAGRIGMTFSTVSRWERGVGKPSRVACIMIRKIAQEDYRDWRQQLQDAGVDNYTFRE
jgi:DNA-binding transcriptional regulator YiaG